MTKSVNKNLGFTPTNADLPTHKMDWSSNWAVKKDAGSELVLANKVATYGYPNNIRIAVSDVADVYKGTSIDKSLYLPNRAGVSILSQATQVWTLTDSADTSYLAALPISAHLVLKLPQSEFITAGDVLSTVIGQLAGSLNDAGTGFTSARLAALMRGIKTPSGIGG